MATAKDIRVEPISAQDARAVVRRIHYSGKVDPRSQLNLGVFLNGRLEGAMQFGPSIDKRKIQPLVRDTAWNGFIELNRMAFSDALPRNSESRAMSIAFRMMRKQYPHIEWVVSFADGAQCGDGAIYRAAGFALTNIKKNTSMYRLSDGSTICKLVLEPGFSPNSGPNSIKARLGKSGSETSGAFLKRVGAEAIPGFQLRYIYFLNPAARDRLTVPVLPFSRIDEMGAGMYKGKARVKQATEGDQPEGGGAAPTHALQTSTTETTDESATEARRA